MSCKNIIVLGSILFAATQTAQAGLVAYYDFEGNADNKAGTDFNGIVSGATLTTGGYSGSAYDFDGVNDFITVNLDVNPSNLPQLSWGAWVNSDVATGVKKILSHDNGGFDRTLGMDTRPAPSDTTITSFTGSYVHGTAPVTPGDWQFVAAVYDQTLNQGLLFVDGVASTFSTSFNNFDSTHSFFRIGSNPSFGEYWNGLIDEVFVFDEALSVSDLDDIMKNGISVVSAPEPSTLMLLGFGILGLGFTNRKRA